MSRHIIECLGKSKVTIENGKVIDVKEPKIKYCPLFNQHRNIKEFTPEAIKKNIEFRIDDFGMCTENRQLRMKDFLSFGISEIIATLLDENIVDCGVMVCEGCGTVIINESEMAQGVGGRVSALLETSPIPEIINEIGEENTLNCEINQIKGVEKAIKKGYKNIAVTVATASDVCNINKIKKSHPDLNIYIFAVHTTGLSKKDAQIIFNESDVITSCASKYIREIGDKKSLRTVGQSIPIYSNSEDGKKFIEIRLEKIGGEKPQKENPDLPYPLI